MNEPITRRNYQIYLPRIPARYENALYEDVPKKLRELFEQIPKTMKGLYIHSAIGTGKTHIAYALYHFARLKAEIWLPNPKQFHEEKPTYREGIPLFWNTTELFREMRLDFDRHRESKEMPEEELMKNEGILFLDDIGAEKPSDWVMETFYLIINKRYNEKLPIVFTSNLSIEQLAQTISDRIASRVVETCDIYELVGKDRRLKK